MALRWELTWDDKADDWVGVSGDHRFARILPLSGGIRSGGWQWHLNGVNKSDGFSNVSGFAETEEAAKDAAESAFEDWLRYTDLRQRWRTAPIATAPTDDEERVVLLYCPEQGGWHTGVYFEDSWRAHIDLSIRLEPTHWLRAPPDLTDTA